MKANKKSQITIYIIIALVIIASVILILFLRNKTVNQIDSQNPENYISSCVGNAATKALDIILPQGGYASPALYKLYNNTKIAYLCYNPGWYMPCINQEPMYVEHLEQEIKEIIAGKLDYCFDSLKQSLEKRNYQVNIKNGDFSVNLIPNKVKIDISREIILEKNQDVKKYENFSVIVLSPIYELAGIALEITDKEARNCDFDYSAYKNNYPKYNIDRTFTDDNTRVYTIGNEIKLNFATRSCALPG